MRSVLPAVGPNARNVAALRPDALLAQLSDLPAPILGPPQTPRFLPNYTARIAPAHRPRTWAPCTRCSPPTLPAPQACAPSCPPFGPNARNTATLHPNAALAQLSDLPAQF